MRNCHVRLALLLGFSAAALHSQLIPDAATDIENQLELGSVFPSELPAGVPTTVTVTARIIDPAVTPSSVGLFQVDAAGNTLSQIGTMTGEGPLVDTVRVFTGRPTITLPPGGGGIQACVLRITRAPLLLDQFGPAQNPLPPRCYPSLIFPVPPPFTPPGIPGGPVLVIPTMEILDVSFEEDIGILKDGEGAAVGISDPVWRRARPGVAARNEPAAYAGGKPMKATILIKLNPAPIVPIENATVSGTIAGFAGKVEKTGVTIPAGATTFTIRTMAATQAFPTRTKYWNKMNVTWSLSGRYGNAALSANLGGSDHVVYVTLKDPIDLKDSARQQASILQSRSWVYLTSLHLAVSKDGAATEQDAFLSTWSHFTGQSVTNWEGRHASVLRSQRTSDRDKSQRPSPHKKWAVQHPGGPVGCGGCGKRSNRHSHDG